MISLESGAEDEDEENDDQLNDNSNWEKGEIELAKDILENSDNYFALPSKLDINEYKIMESFCAGQTDQNNKRTLLNAIKGSGAFSRFRTIVRNLGLLENWYVFKSDWMKELAIEWCDDNNIKYIP